MTNYERLILRLIKEDKLEEYDCVDLNYATYCYKNNVKPTTRNNIVNTLTTNCDMVVILKDNNQIN